MLGQYLITFREALEAALVMAIILSYLVRSRKKSLIRYIWYGLFLAMVASFSLGAFIWFSYRGLPEMYEPLFEGIAKFVAVAVLSTMIYWMAIRGKHIKQEMEERLETITSRGTIIGLVSLGFVVVFREGLETVLFLTPLLVEDSIATGIGMSAGIITAILLAYAIFVVGIKINLQKFFYFTSIMLILLAGGLAGSGVHELLEYSEKAGFAAGWLATPAYALNIPVGSPFRDEGIIGSILAVLFGYTISAEWARVIVHVAYLAIALPLVIWIYREQSKQTPAAL
jgi:high-affinity iron transporter